MKIYKNKEGRNHLKMRNKETLELVTNAAKGKIGLLKESKGKYFMSAFLAGMFIGIGILLTFTVGGVSSGLPTNKILMGISFGIALSLVVVFGTELFKGNNMIGVAGFLNKGISFKDMILMWVASYVGKYRRINYACNSICVFKFCFKTCCRIYCKGFKGKNYCTASRTVF